jgi:regulator of sigma D
VVLGIIELGRKLITGLIQELGNVLKKLVSVVFAKFPGIAKRINARIDAAVNRTVQKVNQIADSLKKNVAKVMDFLASKVDQFLGLLQTLYTKAISVLGNFLIGTFLDIMEPLAHWEWPLNNPSPT